MSVPDVWCMWGGCGMFVVIKNVNNISQWHIMYIKQNKFAYNKNIQTNQIRFSSELKYNKPIVFAMQCNAMQFNTKLDNSHNKSLSPRGKTSCSGLQCYRTSLKLKS